MSDFLTILDNHRELLSERGYDEIGLGSPEEPGLFMKKLEYFFSDCIGRARHTNDKQDFFIEAYGFFNDDKDMVAFNFHYEFDPAKKDIAIKSLSAQMNSIKKTFLLNCNSYELPPASRIHRLLVLEELAVKYGTPKPDIETIIKEQYDFLQEFGINPPNFLRDLRLELSKITAFPATQLENIEIIRYIHFDAYDFMQCSFRYQYNPGDASLQLKSIKAKRDEIEKEVLIAGTNNTVTAKQLFKTLKDEQRLKYAKELASLSSGKIKGQKL